MKAALHLPNRRCCAQVYLPGTFLSTHGPTAAGRRQKQMRLSAAGPPPTDRWTQVGRWARHGGCAAAPDARLVSCMNVTGIQCAAKHVSMRHSCRSCRCCNRQSLGHYGRRMPHNAPRISPETPVLSRPMANAAARVSSAGSARPAAFNRRTPAIAGAYAFQMPCQLVAAHRYVRAEPRR